MKSPVKKIREKVGLSQRQFGRALGFDANVVNRLENGKDYLFESVEISASRDKGNKKKGFEFLKRMAKYADINFDHILERQMEFEKSEVKYVKDKLASTNFGIG